MESVKKDMQQQSGKMEELKNTLQIAENKLEEMKEKIHQIEEIAGPIKVEKNFNSFPQCGKGNIKGDRRGEDAPS